MNIDSRNIKIWSTIGSRATFGVAALELAKEINNLMILTCDVLDANKALDWGLVSKVVPNENLIVEAQQIAKKIAAQPPEASRRAKRLLRMSQNVPLQDALEMAASQQSMLQQLDDHREAIDALLEKRKPNYKNSWCN